MSIEKLRPSFTFNEDRINELKKIAPEAFADGKVNWETLKEALGEYLEDDEGQEHFGLFWPGKRQARRMAAVPSKGTLVPIYGEGLKADGTHDSEGINDSRNIFIEGENLEVLKILQKAYAGKIKMIYIDPPYNTGNDFVYDDNFTEPLQEYLRRTGQVDEEGQPLTTNKKADGRFHSKWLSMMYPRLRLAKNLLREDGAIFISIDSNELHNLKAIMNEIFGEENFVGQITIINNLKGRNDKKNIAQCHEYLIIYQKSNFESLGLPLTKEQLKKFKYIDENREKYALRDLRKRGRPDRREDRPNMYFPIYYDIDKKSFSLEKMNNDQTAIYPKRGDMSDGRWRWGKEKVKINLNILHAKYSEKKDRWDIQHRVYLNPNIIQDINDDYDELEEFENFSEEQEDIQRTSKSKSFWMGGEISTDVGRREFKQLFEDKMEFDYPKAIEFLKRCLHMSLGFNDIVLDYFAGSCGISQATYELNIENNIKRKYICIQLPEILDIEKTSSKETKRNIQKNIEYLKSINKPLTIAEIGKERIKRTTRKIYNNSNEISNNIDLGFKCFRLEFSNYKEWTNYEDADLKKLELKFDQFETPLRENWTEQGLLAETMLIEGFPLDSTIESLAQFKTNKIRKVSSEFCDHALLVCFDEKINDATIGQLDLNEKDIFICLDSAIADQAKLRLADKGLIKTI
ncbi:MAG: site-specific DNA-methyltransferase [Acidobacteria bacterium]|nr:site-specific DNA-methyltransferase [Acidobacteriota bacterium]